MTFHLEVYEPPAAQLFRAFLPDGTSASGASITVPINGYSQSCVTDADGYCTISADLVSGSIYYATANLAGYNPSDAVMFTCCNSLSAVILRLKDILPAFMEFQYIADGVSADPTICILGTTTCIIETQRLTNIPEGETMDYSGFVKNIGEIDGTAVIQAWNITDNVELDSTSITVAANTIEGFVGQFDMPNHDIDIEFRAYHDAEPTPDDIAGCLELK